MASGGKDSMSDEIISLKCCVCLEENRTREAEKYCVECKNYYCSSCVGMHKKIPMMKGHKFLNKADFRKGGLGGSLPSFPTQRYPLHTEEAVKMFCREHDEVTCASCIAINHRNCTNVVSVHENIDNLYNQVSLNDAKKKIRTIEKCMEVIKKTKINKREELKRMLNEKIDSVKAFRQELQALLVVLEEETIQQLRGEFNRIEASINKDINKVETLFTSLHEASSQLIKSEGNKSQEFVCVKSSQKLAAKAKEVEINQQLASDGTISFTPDHSIKAFLQQKKTLSKVPVDKHKKKAPISMPEGLKYTPKDGLYKVKQHRNIDVKLKHDKIDCVIYGACVTEDGFLLLADRRNRKLKYTDMLTYKVKAYIGFHFALNAVCTIITQWLL